MRLIKVVTGLVLGVVLLAAIDARAADFTITKDVNAGTFSFTDANPSDPVFEVVVSGLGTTAGTTLPGFSASAILFGSDPQNCLPVLGSTITSGFCYNLTDPTVGKPITGGTTVFTYDSEFDTTDPSEFAVAFDLPNGTVGVCFGNTGANGGCSASVPEPRSVVVMLSGLLALAGLLGIGGFVRIADHAS